MSFLRSGGIRLKPKLTLRSLSEFSRLRAPASDGAVDENVADDAVLAQKVVCTMRRGDDKDLRVRDD